MAYTGTGTQQDPYLVSTFADFLTCIAQTNAYVKITADIDASQEEAYQSAITSPISLNAKKIYADTLLKIENFAVTGSNVFYANLFGQTEIENINFRNIVFKQTANSYLFRKSAVSNVQKPIFRNCQFSFVVSAGSYYTVIAQETIFQKCAVYAEFQYTSYSTSTNLDTIAGSVTASDSIFEFENLLINRPAGIAGKLTYCTLKLKMQTKLASNPSFTLFSSSDSHDNILIIQMYNTNNGNLLSASYSVNGLTAVDSTVSGYNFSGNVFTLTTAQIQSEEYLRSINFIP